MLYAWTICFFVDASENCNSICLYLCGVIPGLSFKLSELNLSAMMPWDQQEQSIFQKRIPKASKSMVHAHWK